MDGLALELGVTTVSFNLPYDDCNQCATNTWIKHVWKFCWEHNVTIHMPPPKLIPNRENDINIMERFIQQGYSKSYLASLNRCRIYLKVIWLSDITTVDGKNINKVSYQGKYQPNYKSAYTWATIQRPKPTEWTAWRMALRQCFDHQMPTMLLNKK